MSVHNPRPRLRIAPRHIPVITYDTAARRAHRPPYRVECTCGQWDVHATSHTAANWAHHTRHANPGTTHVLHRTGRAA